jgi:hypothetical protein
MHDVVIIIVSVQSLALMTDAATTSETSEIYQITRRNIPDDSNFHTRRRENLKPHVIQQPCTARELCLERNMIRASLL